MLQIREMNVTLQQLGEDCVYSGINNWRIFTSYNTRVNYQRNITLLQHTYTTIRTDRDITPPSAGSQRKGLHSF
jgi:hypothetical protein